MNDRGRKDYPVLEFTLGNIDPAPAVSTLREAYDAGKISHPNWELDENDNVRWMSLTSL